MIGMMGPEWLAIFFGIVMLVASAYAVFRCVFAWATGRATDYGVEVCHALMGISMAGMLIPALHIVQPGVSIVMWIIISALVTVWFVVSVLRDSVTRHAERQYTGRMLHHLPHIVLSAAMVYMLVVLALSESATFHTDSSHSAGSNGMAMQSSMHIVQGASLDLVFALFMIGYLVILIDRFPSVDVRPRVVVSRSGTLRELFAPRGASALSISMAAGMAYMLIMMFA